MQINVTVLYKKHDLNPDWLKQKAIFKKEV